MAEKQSLFGVSCNGMFSGATGVGAAVTTGAAIGVAVASGAAVCPQEVRSRRAERIINNLFKITTTNRLHIRRGLPKCLYRNAGILYVRILLRRNPLVQHYILR